MRIKFEKEKGFTIIELVVSIGIFALMTILLLAKYGNFNQGILLTNLAYDVALTIRNAQSYGLNVKSAVRDDDSFLYPYGVHFLSGANDFVFFADTNSDGSFLITTDMVLSKTTIQRGSKISSLCVGSSDCMIQVNSLDISFKRPDPNAIIIADGSNASIYKYAEISLESSDGTIRKVIVRSTGQISVEN